MTVAEVCRECERLRVELGMLQNEKVNLNLYVKNATNNEGDIE